MLEVSPSGTLSMLAGSGRTGPPTPGRGDAPAPSTARLGVAVDADRNVYIADATNGDVEEVFSGVVTKAPGVPQDTGAPAVTGTAKARRDAHLRDRLVDQRADELRVSVELRRDPDPGAGPLLPTRSSRSTRG